LNFQHTLLFIAKKSPVRRRTTWTFSIRYYLLLKKSPVRRRTTWTFSIRYFV